jgi:hypothetical protein
MDAYLTFAADRQRLLCEETQARLGLPASSIEKDFWVCWTLREMFALPEWGERLTFKGGTSLSKGWKLIERFSEDIDVVIDRDFLGFGGDTLSNKQLNRLRETCSERVQAELLPALLLRFRERIPDAESWVLELAGPEDDPDRQTILFRYPTRFNRAANYVQPAVRIELGARSETEPTESPNIQPFIAETFPDVLGSNSIVLRTVAPRRTFWEKAMLLHEETYRSADKQRKPRLSRHHYDLWCLIRKGVAEQAVRDEGLFERVATHRRHFFRQRWMDYATLSKGTLRLIPLKEQEEGWRRDYTAMRAEMFFNDPPSFDDILAVVREFEQNFNRARTSPTSY